MRQKSKLIQLTALLFFVLVIVGFTPGKNILTSNAQDVAISPTFNCLGPCPKTTGSTSPTVSGNPSVSPVVSASSPSPKVSSTPCQGPNTFAHNDNQIPDQRGWGGKGHGKRSNGGFLRILSELLNLLLQLITGGNFGGNMSTGNSNTTTNTTNTPCSPTASPSAAVSTAPAASSTPATSGDTVNDCGNKPRVKANCSDPNVVCINQDMTTELKIDQPGKIYEGNCHKVAGIRGDGVDNVTVQGFNSFNAGGTGIWLKGKNDTIRDNTITQVTYAGDDIDAMRFFGDGFKIINNKSTDVLSGTDEHGAHLDCMQTYDTQSGGPSSNVTIEDNYCDSPHFHQCVMAEGPASTDGGGGGGGVSQNWTIKNNHFACHASQTIKLDDIDNGTIEGNNFAGSGDRAIFITPLSTGWKVQNNTLGTGYKALQ